MTITEEVYCPLSGSFPGEILPRDCADALAIKGAVIKALAEWVAGQSELLSKRAQREPEMQIVGSDSAGRMLIIQSGACYTFGPDRLGRTFDAATKLGAPEKSDWDSEPTTVEITYPGVKSTRKCNGLRFSLRRPKKC